MLINKHNITTMIKLFNRAMLLTAVGRRERNLGSRRITSVKCIGQLFNSVKLNNERTNIRICKETFVLSDDDLRIIGDNIPYSFINHFTHKKVFL